MLNPTMQQGAMPADMDYESYKLNTGDDNLDRFDYGFLKAAEKGVAKSAASNQFSAAIRAGSVGVNDIISGFQQKNAALGTDAVPGSTQNADGSYSLPDERDALGDNSLSGQVTSNGGDDDEGDDYSSSIDRAKKDLARMGITQPDHKQIIEAINHRNEVYSKQLTQPILGHSSPSEQNLLLSVLAQALGIGGAKHGVDLATAPFKAAELQDQQKFGNDQRQYQMDSQNLQSERHNADQNVADARYMDNQQQDAFDKGMTNYRLHERDVQASKDRQAALSFKSDKEKQDDLDRSLKDALSDVDKTFNSKGGWDETSDQNLKQKAAQIAFTHNLNPDEVYKYLSKYKAGDVSLNGRKFSASELKESKVRASKIWNAYLSRVDHVGEVTQSDIDRLSTERTELMKDYPVKESDFPLPILGKSWQRVQAEANGQRADDSLGLQKDKFDYEKQKGEFDKNVIGPWKVEHAKLDNAAKSATQGENRSADNLTKAIAEFNKMHQQKGEDQKVFEDRRDKAQLEIRRLTRVAREAKDAASSARKKLDEHTEPGFQYKPTATRGDIGGTLPSTDGLTVTNPDGTPSNIMPTVPDADLGGDIGYGQQNQKPQSRREKREARRSAAKTPAKPASKSGAAQGPVTKDHPIKSPAKPSGQTKSAGKYKFLGK